MNKNQIINILNSYKFDKNEYIIISGAAMVLLGIKETTRDIDISVTDKYYKYLLSNFDCNLEKVNEYGEKVYFIDNIINFSRTYYTENKKYILKIPVQEPKDIIILKQKLNREKDIKDIKLIKEYLNE